MSPSCCSGANIEGSTLDIYQGDDYLGIVTVYNASTQGPADLTGYTARAQLRRNIADEDPVVAAEVTCTITLPNIITLSILHDVTKGLSGIYMWDLELISDTGAIETIMTGDANVTPEITRAPIAQIKNVELVNI